MPMLVGNLVAILSSALVCVVVSLIKPDRYDWKSTREISMVDDAETGAPRAAPAAWGTCARAGTWSGRARPCLCATQQPA
jgi:hypothetical protein